MEINDDYEIDYQNYIGKGSFGVVYKGKDKKTGELVAIKKIEYDHSNSIEIVNEINNMKLLNSCKYSISIIKTYKDDRFYYIIMELCDKSLNKLIEGKNNLDLKTIKLILKQLNVVFKKMRELNMIHRDIKPLNILLKKENNKLTVRLTDYGLTKILSTSNKASTIARIPFYIAPEIKLEEFSDIKFSDKSKVDLWSIGIMIHELYFKKFPFKSQLDYINYLQHNGNSQYININKSPDNDFNNLIENLLVFDYRNRISWNDYFAHKFFLSFVEEKNKVLKNLHNLSEKISNFILSQEEIIKKKIELIKQTEIDEIISLNNKIEKLLLIKDLNNEYFNEYFSIINPFNKEKKQLKINKNNESIIKKKE